MRFVRHAAPAALALVFGLTATGAFAETVHVTIKGFKFQPAEVSAKVGDTIEWSNEDTTPHSATAKGGAFDVSVPPGKTGSFTAAAAGDFDYACRFHPMMHGKVTVAP